MSIWNLHMHNREPGLKAAIAAAGGINALAHRLGINGPSVHRWRRVPQDRIVQIEREVGVPRAVLRPDLYEERADG